MTSHSRDDRLAARQLRAIEGIAACRSLDDLVAPLSRLIEELKFGSCRLAIVAPRPQVFEVVGAIVCEPGNRRMPDEGPASFSRDDPMIDDIFVKGLPTVWLPYVDGRKSESPRARALWADGDVNGLSVMSPIGGGWMTLLCAFANDQDSDAFEQRVPGLIPTLLLAAAAAAHPARSFILSRAEQALTPTEREILLGISQGLRPAEIAKRRGTAEPTVRNQIVALRQKLAAKSTPHAVAIAIQYGLI